MNRFVVDARRRLPLSLAVLAAAGFSALIFAGCAIDRDRLNLPGASIALAADVLLGYFAIRGREWARWTFFSLVLLRTLAFVFFTFIDMGTGKARPDFDPKVGLIAAMFAAIAVAAALSTNRRPANPPLQRTATASPAR
jgi:peptidoglycan/LPS O-acetylase OafA/YrhL